MVEITGLPSAFVQCARDRALWSYRSYKRLHKEWERRVDKLEKDIEKKKAIRKLYRLKKREPSIPRVDKKQPIFFDSRIGKIEMSENSKLFKFWARISTLHKGERREIPLHIHPYAEKHLRDWEIKSFQIVDNYRLKRWEVHVVVKIGFFTPFLRKKGKQRNKNIKIKNVAGIDLGINDPQ